MSVSAFNKIHRLAASSIIKCRNVRHCSQQKKKEEDDLEIPVNELKQYYSANDQPGTGRIFDNKPFKFTCEAGKVYSWCLCGYSHRQPFCDGTHRSIHLKIKMRPIQFCVKETKSYWLCNCKQTSNRPFCDGSHKSEEVQSKKL